MNYKAPLIKSLEEAGFESTDTYGGARMTFTHLRKDGTRRMKLWFGNDVWDADREKQLKLEERLKSNYGNAYLGGYFILGPRCLGKSFCIVLDTNKQ